MNKTLGAVFGAALAILGTISASMAAPAFVTGLGNVYDAPGRASSVVAILPEGATVDANCTNDGWCQITGIGGSTGTNGWMMSNNVRFGDLNPPRPQPPQPQPPQPWPPQPQPQPWPPQPPPWPWPQPPKPQPRPPVVSSGACFYSERNFGGNSFCVDRGDSFSRMPRNWNDRIRSVEVFGRNTRVDLCVDTNFRGSCVTLRSDTGRLPAGIDRRASSIDVY